MSNKEKGLTRREFMELTATGAAALTLGGLGSVYAAGPTRGGTLTCGMSRMKRTMDPHRRTGGFSMQTMALSWEGLTDPLSYAERTRIAQEKGPDNVPVVKPMLADSWEIDKAGRRYVFHLKKGVKYHNGKEMDSEDVKWCWERIKDPVHQAQGRIFLTQKLESAETPDRYTVVANLSEPYAPFLIANSWFNTCIIPKDAIPHGVVWGDTPTFKTPTVAPPGTGPFIPVKYQQRLETVFERFDNYRISQQPYLDKVVFKEIPKDGPRTLALRAGNVDYIIEPDAVWMAKYVTWDDLQQPIHIKEDKMTLYPFYSLGVEGVGFNCYEKSDSPFKDVRVRQALSLCIDRDVLAKTVYGPLAIPMAQGHHWANSPWGFEDIQPPKPDIEKAKNLLAEAGYPNGLDVEYTINPPRGRIETTVQVIQQMARPAGFRITVRPIKGAQFGKTLRKYEYDICRLNFTKDDPIQSYWDKLHTNVRFKGYSQYLGIKDPLIDKWLDEVAVVSDVKKRREILKKVVLRNNEMAYLSPYFMIVMGAAWSDKLKNFRPWDYYGLGEMAFKEAWIET